MNKLVLLLTLALMCGCQCNKCEPLNCEEVTPMNAAQCIGQEKNYE
jgi:hypothetical protein